ncbi:uncharacterized protein [Procambarus clarkii]|uniref:uncharacterized protein n=1 Tax=Procambarus clarkii TaxID=6728 RepID=UPI0037445F9E
MAATGGGRIRRVNTARLEFSAPVDWELVAAALLDVLQVDVKDLLGLEKFSPTRVAVTFATSPGYERFVGCWNERTTPLPHSAVSVTVSDPWGPLTFVSVHGVPVTFPEVELSSVFTRDDVKQQSH